MLLLNYEAMLRSLSRTVSTLLTFLVLLGICSVLCSCTKPPQNEKEVWERAYRLQQWGRYDAAAGVIQNWMNRGKGDASRNDFLHFEIAMIYLTKASKGHRAREESLRSAALHLGQALSIHNSEQPKDMDVMLFEIGGAYEILGDLSERGKCNSYEKAAAALERQLPLIQGDSYTAYGKTTPLEPVRADVRRHIKSVSEKLNQAGCNVPQAH